MPVEITEMTDQHVSAVEAFNARLRAGGMTMQLPPQPIPDWLPPAGGRKLFQQPYVALDQTGEVRGGYILKHQEFKIGDSIEYIADLRLPISEGTVNRDYADMATTILFDALSKQKSLFGLGMGGAQQPVAQLFKAAGWRIFPVPFYFRVLRPFRFFRRIKILRSDFRRRAAMDLAALTGLGAVAVKGRQMLLNKRPDDSQSLRVDRVDDFGNWADDLWNRSRDQYRMIAVRNLEVLRMLYDVSDPRFMRLRVSRGDQVIGWCVALDTQMTDHKQFGSLRLGSLVDGLAATEDAHAVVSMATRYLQDRHVDLIISNQSHAAWGEAFKNSGYLSGPSNYLFAGSRKLDKLMKQSEISNDQTFINRGDGDGPIHL